MSERFDTIVIGSGFGGGVMACRLAEKGDKVLVLERGRQWDKAPHEYENPPWIFDPDEPEKQNGWLDLRFMDDMIVAQGAAVGGGSLIYANVSVEAPKQIFDKGWPREIDYEQLLPFYQRVGDMLDVKELPDGQLTPRYRLMERGARALGFDRRFDKVPLAINFDEEWSYELEDPFDRKHSKTKRNRFGKDQGTCIHLGYCDIGCPVKAKNTIDLNYLALAEKHGADIRPLHIVRWIEPEGTGYRVTFDRIELGKLQPGHAVANRVVVAAGSLGSTELLLRCRDQYKTLPGLSRFLGRNWSSNGDFLTPAFYEDGSEINPTKGPTISSAIDFLDGSEGGDGFYIEDGGFPDLLEAWIRTRLDRGVKGRRFRKLLNEGLEALERSPFFDNVMPWFAQGIDAADGRLYLGRKWYAPWKRKLALDWDIERSKETIDAILAMHERLAEATGGNPWTPPSYSLFANLATPHPLGGCNMGDAVESGVVNHRGEVFGYPNLYVVDGAIIPEAIGRNPSRTIAALAERAADLAR